MVKIAKFGGSSLANATQFQKVKNIVLADPERKYVVVSASGRRTKEDNKITDLLYLCHAHIQYSVSYERIFSMIENRFRSIKDELKLDFDLESEFLEIRKKMDKNIDIDYLVSRGEYLTARLMAEYLGYDFVDAKDIVKFAYDGEIDFEATAKAMEIARMTSDRMVIPGFYGSLPDGTIKVLSRGGSDITGSIIAKLVHAKVYENWTDVSGILMADPRIVDNPKRIEKITYSELRELSYMGANVLHEEAIFPVKEENIPINIRNTNEPDNPGTIIITNNDEDDSSSLITGLAGKQNFAILTVYKKLTSDKINCIEKALDIISSYKVNLEHLTTGIDSFSLVIDTNNMKVSIFEIVSEIERVCDPMDVNVIEEVSLIATVGRNMASRPGMSGKLFSVLGEKEINVRMITQGSDEINIIIGVKNSDFKKAIRAIYNSFAN